MSEFCISLSDARYNAGVLGFIRVLERAGIPHRIEGHTLFVGDDLLQLPWAVTNSYFDILIDRYQGAMRVSRIIRLLNSVLDPEAKAQDNFKEALQGAVKGLEDEALCASYLNNVYPAVEARLDGYDFEAEVKEAKKAVKSKDLVVDDLLARLALLRDNFVTNKRAFLISDISYANILPFWGAAPQGPGYVFNLLTTKKRKVAEEKAASEEEQERAEGTERKAVLPEAEHWLFDKCFHHTFLLPLLEQGTATIQEGSRTKHCCQCGRGILPGIKKTSLSFVTDLVANVTAKQNMYWDCQVDSHACPLCRLIYACTPIGFTMMGQEAAFVNASSSIEALLEADDTLRAVRADAASFPCAVGLFLVSSELEKAACIMENVQILRRMRTEDGWRYRTDAFGCDDVERLAFCRYELSRIAKYPVYTSTGTGHLCSIETAMPWVLNEKTQYNALLDTMQTMLVDKFGQANPKTERLAMRDCYDLLRINVKMTAGASRKECLDKLELARQGRIAGMKLATVLFYRMSVKKLYTHALRFLLLIRGVAVDKFVQMATQMFLANGCKVPSVFIDTALTDLALFRIFGAAFVIGLAISPERVEESPAGDADIDDYIESSGDDAWLDWESF